MRYAKGLPKSVISIGNITTGGTGKTPVVIALAKEALRRGLYPIVLTRGYRGHSRGPYFVTSHTIGPKWEHLFCTSFMDSGDEPMLMAMKLPETPIVKCPKRYEGGLFAIKHLESFSDARCINRIDRERIVFLLDDGFQHWHLKRDVDIVIIDGFNPFGNGMLLPFGRLREPLNALGRAHCLVITRQENPEAAEEIRKFNKDAPIFTAVTQAKSLVDVQGCTYPCNLIEDKRVFAFSGIGNPGSFVSVLRSLRPTQLNHRAFMDHHLYTIKDIDRITSEAAKGGADIVITTEKDMVKIRAIAKGIRPYALVIDMDLGNDFYNHVFGG